MRLNLRIYFPEVLFGMLLSVAIFAVGAAFWSSPNSSTPAKQQSSANRSQKQAGHPQPSSFRDWITDDATGFFTSWLVIVGGFQVVLFYVQLRLIRKGLKPAEIAAKAAELNAEALMTAEGAHLYPIIKGSNLKDVFYGVIMHPDESPDTNITVQPHVTYCLKNYGKTPAVLERIMHGVAYYPTKSTSRTMSQEDSALEIVVSDGETTEFTVTISGETFTRAKAKAVHIYQAELLFFGEVFFRDFFNRRIQCFWEFDGRRSGFHLYRLEEKPNPDAVL
jgi:hypothetical protein